MLAVLNPVLARQPITLAETTPVSLAATLKEALLSTGQVRLFAFENIGEAVAEQDLKLSSLFAKQYAPRYGRWLASDALVVCQASFPAPDQVVLDLALVNPITAVTLNRVERKGTVTSLSSQVRRERPDYYASLERTQKGDLNVTARLQWFIACFSRAIDAAEETCAGVLRRAEFW